MKTYTEIIEKDGEYKSLIEKNSELYLERCTDLLYDSVSKGKKKCSLDLTDLGDQVYDVENLLIQKLNENGLIAYITYRLGNKTLACNIDPEATHVINIELIEDE